MLNNNSIDLRRQVLRERGVPEKFIEEIARTTQQLKPIMGFWIILAISISTIIFIVYNMPIIIGSSENGIGYITKIIYQGINIDSQFFFFSPHISIVLIFSFVPIIFIYGSIAQWRYYKFYYHLTPEKRKKFLYSEFLYYLGQLHDLGTSRYDKSKIEKLGGYLIKVPEIEDVNNLKSVDDLVVCILKEKWQNWDINTLNKANGFINWLWFIGAATLLFLAPLLFRFEFTKVNKDTIYHHGFFNNWERNIKDIESINIGCDNIRTRTNKNYSYIFYRITVNGEDIELLGLNSKIHFRNKSDELDEVLDFDKSLHEKKYSNIIINITGNKTFLNKCLNAYEIQYQVNPKDVEKIGRLFQIVR